MGAFMRYLVSALFLILLLASPISAHHEGGENLSILDAPRDNLEKSGFGFQQI